MKYDEINSLDSESGIIATLIHNPEFSFYSEFLFPDQFTNKENRYVYTAISSLAQKGIKTIDAFNILEILGSDEATRYMAEELSVDKLNELIEMSDILARNTLEEYKMLVDNVLDSAFRRDTLGVLDDCRRLCLDRTAKDVEQQIYDRIDNIMVEYSTNNDVPQYKEVVDECWEQIQSRQGDGYAGLPFKFSALNEYVTIEKGELVIFSAEAKQGKSMMLLNCAVDLLNQGKSVLYLDSELNTRLFTARILSHISGIEYKRLTSGCYSAEEKTRIDAAREWIKTQNFTHIYIPMFDIKSIYTAIKKIYHTTGIDVLIVDYFKSSSEGDAFDSYQELGRFVDTIKNQVCGGLNIAGIGAAQATSAGKVADSAKIGRNASTICIIQEKTPEEIEMDGVECGNKKLRVVLNRNGAQMAPGEYIDLWFDGNKVMYSQAKQHIPQNPF